MRIIKFRGKRVDNGEWVYGYYTEHTDRESGIFGYEQKYSMIHDNAGEMYDVIHETVCQFTGLHDKNGREIYEGDIIRINHSIFEEPTYHEVKYGIEQDYPAFDLYQQLDFVEGNNLQYFVICDIYDYYVVGNIHDNKELLK